jgi:HlyD family secretion protein
MRSFFSTLRTHAVLLVCLVIFGWVIWSYLTKPEVPLYETELVSKRDVLQVVAVTGRVEAQSSASLSFERGGKVSTLPLPVGSVVKKGEVLVRQDTTELEAGRAQARANLDYEVARLEELNRGARNEDIAILETKVQSAQISRSDAGVTLKDKADTALEVSDNGIFNRTDQLFENPRSRTPRIAFPVSDQKLIDRLESMRKDLTDQMDLLPISGTPAEVASAVTSHILLVSSYFDALAQAVNALTPSSQYSQTTIDAWKSSVALARTELTAAQSALLASEQKYRSESSALLLAEHELALKKAPPTSESIRAQEAKIVAARAQVSTYTAQIERAFLRAPFDGVITKQDAAMGEAVLAGTIIAIVSSRDAFQVVTYVPEVDVAKLSLGDKAVLTLDAYGKDQTFSAEVLQIDPSETLLEGVSTYKVTLVFTNPTSLPRSGMTANIDIATDEKRDVLTVPFRAIVTRDGQKFVRIPDGISTKEVEVTLGLRGSDGMVEVLSGLREGEPVVTFLPTSK